MNVVGHHCEGGDLHADAEEPGEVFQAVANPGPAMVVGVARDRIDAAEESPAPHPLHTVIDPDLIRDHDFRAIPPCHAQMLPIGRRCLRPVGRRPSQRHDDQTYQRRRRSSSSYSKLWVALTALNRLGIDHEPRRRGRPPREKTP